MSYSSSNAAADFGTVASANTFSNASAVYVSTNSSSNAIRSNTDLGVRSVCQRSTNSGHRRLVQLLFLTLSWHDGRLRCQRLLSTVWHMSRRRHIDTLLVCHLCSNSGTNAAHTASYGYGCSTNGGTNAATNAIDAKHHNHNSSAHSCRRH